MLVATLVTISSRWKEKSSTVLRCLTILGVEVLVPVIAAAKSEFTARGLPTKQREGRGEGRLGPSLFVPFPQLNRLRAEFNAESLTPPPFTRLPLGPLRRLLGPSPDLARGPQGVWPRSAGTSRSSTFRSAGLRQTPRTQRRDSGLRRLRGLRPLRLLRPSVPALRPLRLALTSAPPFRGPKRAAPRYKTPKGPRQIQRGPNKTARGPKFRLVNGEGLIPL